jgi:hypothetical protein
MTPEEDARIRELPKLMEAEEDPIKVEMLAAELQRFLSIDGNARKTMTTNERPAP